MKGKRLIRWEGGKKDREGGRKRGSLRGTEVGKKHGEELYKSNLPILIHPNLDFQLFRLEELAPLLYMARGRVSILLFVSRHLSFHFSARRV